MKDGSQLLRRLNPNCQTAMEASASLCQTRGHSEITLDHFLIKLLELGDGDFTAILRRYEIDVDSIWQSLLITLDKFPRNVRGNPRLSQSLLDTLSDSWLLAVSEDGASEIRSNHIYRALLNAPHRLYSQDAWQLFSLSTIQIQRLLPWLDEVSCESPANQYKVESTQSPEAQLSPKTNQTVETNQSQVENTASNDLSQNESISRFTINLTQKAKEGKIDPVFGRDIEIRQMIDILSRRRKNNPILVGDPGVGKTAIVEGLALKITSEDVPPILKNTQVLILDLGLLQAGAGVKGEFEQRLKNVIQAIQNSSESVLLFIDEAHTLIGAGNTAGGADAANLLKPALARGELRTIAATTWSEYKQYFEKDAALERRFQMVKVDEPDDEGACLMLRGLKSRYEQHHQIHIYDQAIDAAVKLSRKYLTGRQLPDKAVDLLDTAAARVKISLDSTPQQILQMQGKLNSLQSELKALEEDAKLQCEIDPKRIQELQLEIQDFNIQQEQTKAKYEEEKTLVAEMIELNKILLERLDKADADQPNASTTELEQQIKDKRAALKVCQGANPLILTDVNADVIAKVISDWTGIPVGSLLKDELRNLLALEELLKDRVIGQDQCIDLISQSLRSAKAGLKTNDSPLGVFLLTGPSGVGKTETALALADTLFGGEQSLITINLSEYQESHTVSQLKGSPPGYVGYGQGGVLTEAVRQKPYSVVLLDEVEKAHRDILNIFYQVFDKGIMRDGEGREIDFKNTVILMTSNLGGDELIELLQPQEEEQEQGVEVAEASEEMSEKIVDEQDADTPNGDEIAEPLAVEPKQAIKYTQGEMLEHIRPILVKHFQAALLARMQTVVYQPLDKPALAKIVQLKLDKVSKRMSQQHCTVLTYTPQLVEILAQSCLVVDSGARNIDHLLNQQILPAIANGFLQWQIKQNVTPVEALLDFTEQGIQVDFK